jgi:hypothetical protein
MAVRPAAAYLADALENDAVAVPIPVEPSPSVEAGLGHPDAWEDLNSTGWPWLPPSKDKDRSRYRKTAIRSRDPTFPVTQIARSSEGRRRGQGPVAHPGLGTSRRRGLTELSAALLH